MKTQALSGNPIACAILLCAALCGCKANAPTPIADNVTTPRAQPQAMQERSQASGTGHRRAARSRPSTNTQPGAFDFYLLNLSWSPAFCATHASPECASHPGFVVHGLWPQNDDGTYPENCSNAPGPVNPQVDTDLMPTVSLVEHEWQTHGTCSGLTSDTYFSDVRTAFDEIHIPAPFVNVSRASTLAPSAILSQFASANPGLPADSFALSCGNNVLTAIEVCLSKDLHGISCPAVRSCGATVIGITPQ